jgi:hypothetical protein
MPDVVMLLTYHVYSGANDVLDIYPPAQQLDSIDSIEAAAVKVRLVHPQHAFRIIPDGSTPGYEEETTATDEIEACVEGRGAALVRLYFRVIHPAFPILHKDVFLEKYARSCKSITKH